MAEQIVDQIDAGLGRFYSQKGVQGYFDGDGVGKFKAYCEENGFDDDMICDEMKEDPGESQLVDFDGETFPSPEDLEDEEIAKLILSVINKCATDAQAYKGAEGKYEAIKVKPEHWDITKQDIEAVKRLYQAQLKTLFDVGMGKDQSILKLLAVGRKLQQPYLLYLADAYMRTKVDSGKDSMSTATFTLNSKHFKQLSNFSKSKDSPFELATAALKSFFARINPELMFKPSSLIVGDLENTCELLFSAMEFVANCASGKFSTSATCPFQFDACFAFQGSQDTSNTVGDVDNEDDDDDDDDDEEKGDGDKKGKDWFGDIQAKLKAEKLSNSMSKLTVEHRGFIDPFKGFVSDNKMQKDNKGYPHRRRFCALIDGRKGEAEDILHFYEPPKNCDTFPNGEYVQLWYFDSSKTCILPDLGYNAGKEKAKAGVTAGTACGGTTMTFSFHVEAEDNIRCYMYANGGMMRFMPEDIINVLPKFFAGNEEWPKSKAATELVEKMKPLLVDARFQAFYESCK